jgi:hypothetical protein
MDMGMRIEMQTADHQEQQKIIKITIKNKWQH